MSDLPEPKKIEVNEDGWPIYDLWDRYEDIAMHFNDLLIRLRTQAIGAVAALTTIIGIFAKSEADTKTNWEMVAFALAIIIIFWIAVWILDFTYYNRLLLGAVAALLDLEKASKDKVRVHHINVSTKIEEAVASAKAGDSGNRNLTRGRWWFYSLVFLALLGALAFAIFQICTAGAPHSAAWFLA